MNKESSQTKMQPQIVRSYIRGNKQVSNEVPDRRVNNVMALSILAALAVILWQVTVPALLLVGGAYGLRQVILSESRRPMVEATVEPANAPEVPTKKRHYQHRLLVTHYETGRTIRV